MYIVLILLYKSMPFGWRRALRGKFVTQKCTCYVFCCICMYILYIFRYIYVYLSNRFLRQSSIMKYPHTPPAILNSEPMAVTNSTPTNPIYIYIYIYIYIHSIAIPAGAGGYIFHV